MRDQPLILVSNDDGVNAPGNVALRKALRAVGRVVTVAPEREQSGFSHSITLHRPLRHRQVGEDVHAIDGTPVDCIYIALYHGTILDRAPDVVVSGINHGPNLGTDVYYSGTVAAAREGALRGIPSMAISLVGRQGFEEAAELAVGLVSRLLVAARPSDQAVLLNVNVPPGPVRGVRATRLGRRVYTDEVDVRRDPRGREYFWIGGPGARHEPVDGSDTSAVDDGFASVTPIELRGTHAEHMTTAAEVAKEGNE